MPTSNPVRHSLETARLSLRPTESYDADGAFEIQSDWRVTRMLRMARYPPDFEEMRRWFKDHQREWLDAEAYRFAVELAGRLIGVVDIDEIDGSWGHLGYWLAQDAWRKGYASEAAQAVVRFAFDEAGLVGLRSGHAEDNPASGRVLLKLGFHQVATVGVTSHSRGESIPHVQYERHRPT